MKTGVTVANANARGTKALSLGDCEVAAHEGLPHFTIKPHKEPLRIRKAWQKLTKRWLDFENPEWLKRTEIAGNQ